jgi:hypothetical protein
MQELFWTRVPTRIHKRFKNAVKEAGLNRVYPVAYFDFHLQNILLQIRMPLLKIIPLSRKIEFRDRLRESGIATWTSLANNPFLTGENLYDYLHLLSGWPELPSAYPDQKQLRDLNAGHPVYAGRWGEDKTFPSGPVFPAVDDQDVQLGPFSSRLWPYLHLRYLQRRAVQFPSPHVS